MNAIAMACGSHCKQREVQRLQEGASERERVGDWERGVGVEGRMGVGREGGGQK